MAVATFKHHTGPITSVEWHPTDSSVFVASGADNQVTLWDLAVERDNETEGKGRHLDVPPQLLFIHMVCQLDVIREKKFFPRKDLKDVLRFSANVLRYDFWMDDPIFVVGVAEENLVVKILPVDLPMSVKVTRMH